MKTAVEQGCRLLEIIPGSLTYPTQSIPYSITSRINTKMFYNVNARSPQKNTPEILIVLRLFVEIDIEDLALSPSDLNLSVFPIGDQLTGRQSVSWEM